MYKVDLPPDLKEAAAIERRRNREQQRQSRVFNAKFRTIGVDVDTLEKQVQEKKQKEEIEKARDEAFDASRQQYDKIAQMLEQEQQAVTRNLDVALEDFRVRHQQPDTRREFDLYDPQGLKKDRPARVCDDDPRCGPASLQKFAGEDLSEKERTKLQKDMIKKWLTLQNEETQRAEAHQKFADNLYDKKRIELDERAQHLSRMEEECRKAIDMATNNFNEALALEITERRNLEKQQEEDNNFAEIYNHLTGDILTENPDVAVSNLGPQRILTDRWKGMSPEELKAVWNIQEQQRQEKQRLNEEEKQRDAEWDRQRTLAARASMTLEQQEEEFNKELRKRIDSYNEQLGREQRAQNISAALDERCKGLSGVQKLIDLLYTHTNYKQTDQSLEYLQKEVYTNKPTAHFFTQFNTSSR